MTMGEFDPNKPYQQPANAGPPQPPAGAPDYGGLAPAYQPVIGALPPGGLGGRAAARIVDLILVEIVALVINLIYGIQTYMHATSNYGATADFDPTGYVLIGTASSGLLMFGYFVVFELLRGRTLGKRLFGLRVHGPAGAPKPDLKQSAIRNSFWLLFIVPYIGWLLVVGASIFIAVTINSSPTKQGKHDELAGGTQVVKV